MTNRRLIPVGESGGGEGRTAPESLQALKHLFEGLSEWADAFDPQQPVTSLHTLHAKLNNCLSQHLPSIITSEEFHKLKAFLGQEIRDGSLFQDLEDEAIAPILSDHRLLQLHQLLDECDRSCHGSPLWILGPLSSVTWSRALTVIAPFFEGEQTSSSEVLARRAQEAFLAVSEPYYLEYLNRLVLLIDTLRGNCRTPGTFEKWRLGDFLKQVKEGLPGVDHVVELDVQRIRNAIAHRSIWYDAASQLIVVRDMKGKVTTLTPEALFQKARAMFEVGIWGLQKLRVFWSIRLFRRWRFIETAITALDLEREASIREAFVGFEEDMARMMSAASQLRPIPDKASS